MAKAKHEWAKLDPRIDKLKAQGWTDTQIAKELNIGRQTLVDHLRSRASVHLRTPETTEVIEVPQETPEHPGTLEGCQEVLEEIQQSVPEVAHLVTDEGHPSTPEVHPEVSVEDSRTAHSGVPARQELGGSIPMAPNRVIILFTPVRNEADSQKWCKSADMNTFVLGSWDLLSCLGPP
jgi:hypothetical protein